jgi:3alpha(or 20beta)-hydroxysteroid dehydrogenase
MSLVVDLTDRVVLVTGGARGIGLGVSRVLASAGATVVSCGRSDAEPPVPGGSHLVCDVRDPAAVLAMVHELMSRHGRLDGLVNNAGIGSLATVEDETVEQWDTVMSVDATGVWLGMKHLGPLIAASGGGSIVNLSSILGTVGGLGNSAAYHAAKGAVRTLTKNAAVHWATSGVRVNSLHPGFIGTPELLARYDGTPRHDAMLANTPVGRLGRSDEIAAVVAFLVSDDSTYVTGSEVYADGGYTAR